MEREEGGGALFMDIKSAFNNVSKAHFGEAEKPRPGLMFTDGSRLDDGAAGYAVVWKNGQSWEGVKTHVCYSQETYDAERAALARALESASRRHTTPERITIFTDAQATIRQIASEGHA